MDPLLSMKHTELPVVEPLTEEVQTVLRMYREKISMSKIGREIGKSRAAVAGIIHRSRKRGLLSDRPLHKFAVNRTKNFNPKLVTVAKATNPILPTVRRSTPFKPKPALAPMLSVPKAPIPRVRLKLVDSPTAVTFQELQPHHCRWPIGDPKQRDFRFCGCQRLSVGPYCEAHTTASLNPLTRRKRQS